MSAFVVSKQHIDAIVTAALPGPGDSSWIRWIDPVDPTLTHRLDRDTADRAGALLWQENRVSVNYRYHDGDPVDVEYRLKAALQNPVTVLKLIDCYEYQSCEHPNWESSQAKALCSKIRKQVIGKLPGYDEAPWGF